jgi:glycosyltransferase involved in cell wall biosynthesis
VFEAVVVSTYFTPGDRVAARAATGLEGEPCLLWVGHLDANKDPLSVLEAVGLAATDLPDVRLYMCFQQAPLRAPVEARISADERLRRRVRLLGRVPHEAMESYYRAADFLVQASHTEGSGYGVIEALACGTAPLVTDIPAFRRLTGNGSVGGLVPVENPAAFAAALVEWSRRDRSMVRARAREHFEAELSFAAIGRQLRDAYHLVVKSRGNGARA